MGRSTASLKTKTADFTAWTVQSAGAQAVNRAAAILRALAVSGAHGANLADLAKAADLPPSTAHRILAALVDERMAERSRTSRRYRLGMEIAALGMMAGVKHDLRSLARPSLERIAACLGHGAHLVIRAGYDVLCLDQIMPSSASPTLGSPGARAPLGVSAHGLALLAHLNEDEIEDAMTHNQRRLADHPAFSVEAILRDVAAARRSGYAVSSLDQAPRIYGVAAPILDSRRRPLAAIGITTLTGDPLPGDQLAAVVSSLQGEAAAIARDYESTQDLVSEPWRQVGQSGG
jgi:DNA-binding IclR family transcriptional regulator